MRASYYTKYTKKYFSLLKVVLQENFFVSYLLQGIYIEGNKNRFTGKVIAYGGYFYFALDAAGNFLARKIGMKIGVN